MKQHPLTKIINLKENNPAVGIYSACSANELVLLACMERAKATNSPLLIEATANQVDQYGGYTGMNPSAFKQFVETLAKQVDLSMDQIILGGDHLGPLTFTKYDEAKAMSEASELIRQYVLAGFTKIHLDTSMKVNSDDINVRLSDEIIAKRGAQLAKVAQTSYQELLETNPEAIAPIYIVGSEVPIPGGVQGSDDSLQITTVNDLTNTIKAFEDAFIAEGLEEAWKQVIGIVVQPGVEEKDSGCTEYDRVKAIHLTEEIKHYPNLVYEAHSTDYQTKEALKELVEDGFKILKVGPGLTYSLRQGLFALANIEQELFLNTDIKQSNFIETLLGLMLEEPKYWEKYYQGSTEEIIFKCKYSFSDRSRYYLPTPKMQECIDILLANLKDGVPLNILSQYMPIQYTKVREKQLKNEPLALLKDWVSCTVDEYLYATNQQELLK